MSEGDVLISYIQGGSFGSVIQTIVLFAMGTLAHSSLERHNNAIVASRSRRSIRFADQLCGPLGGAHRSERQWARIGIDLLYIFHFPASPSKNVGIVVLFYLGNRDYRNCRQ